MSIRKLFLTMVMILPASVQGNAEATEQAAREQASNTVRSELHSKLNFKQDHFLSVQRDEELEESLALAIARRAGVFVYKVSPTGYEIRDDGVFYHAWSDFDVVFIVGINQADGSVYRIHGFGLAQSPAEFERLMTAEKVRVASPEQAVLIADFYRKVNPKNDQGLMPISNLIELKQAAEKQCYRDAKSFDAGEKAFAAWWKRAEKRYAGFRFRETAILHGGGYLVDWIVVSTPATQNCGGSPLRARLEISSDGHVIKMVFLPV